MQLLPPPPLLLLLLLSSFSCARSIHINHTWVDCSSPASHGVFTSSSSFPDPIVAGENATLSGYGRLDKAVTDGQITISVTVDGLPIPVQPSVFPACGNSVVHWPLGLGSILYDALACPTPRGNFTLSELVNVPVLAPLGNYAVQLQGVDQDGEELLCVLSHIEITLF